MQGRSDLIEDKSSPVTLVAGILVQLQLMRKEQTTAFGPLADAITKLDDGRFGRRSAEKEEVATVIGSRADLSNLEQLNEEVKKRK